MTTMLNEPALNSRVAVCITRQIAAGLLGTASSGQRAIIRKREIAWGAALPLEQYVGQTREAVVIGHNRVNNELELSLRLVEWDPWPAAATRYVVGSEVKGAVIGLIEAGAFIELEPGVTGYLPASDLSLGTDQRIADRLWIGDHVKAIVTEVQASARRLRLSLGELLAQRAAQFQRRIWQGTRSAPSSYASVAKALPADVWLRLLRLGSDAELPAGESPLHVLVIEDDPAYAGGLESFFGQNGCQVTLACDGPAGLQQVRSQSQPFHLIVIDWNLPGCKGHEVVRALQLQDTPSRLALVLEPTSLETQSGLGEELRETGIDVFFKADGERCMEGLISILRELREDRGQVPGSAQRHFPASALPRAEAVSPTPAVETAAVAEPDVGLAEILARLKEDTAASAVLLMHLEPGQANLRVESCAGDCGALQQPPPDLIHSELADVLVKRQEIAERVILASARFRKLLALFYFEGFLGLPVPGVQLARYGLILLKERGTFGRIAIQKARLAAYLIAAVLQQRRFADTLEPWQAQNLVGQLASSVVHEVTNKLGGLELEIKALKEGLRQLAQYPPLGGDPDFLHRMEQAAARLADAQQQASELRNRYLGLAAGEEARRVEVNRVAEETMQMLKPEAQQSNVLLELEAATDLPEVRARPGQLRQILLNLGLNAIQQMAAIGRHGVVKIQTLHLPAAPWPVQVRVIDEGPGVHASLWERIFEFGFTTKKDGAGLGLTICRQAAARLGGTVRVEESHMLWGTTFLLELPGGVGDG